MKRKEPRDADPEEAETRRATAVIHLRLCCCAPARGCASPVAHAQTAFDKVRASGQVRPRRVRTPDLHLFRKTIEPRAGEQMFILLRTGSASLTRSPKTSVCFEQDVWVQTGWCVQVLFHKPSPEAAAGPDRDLWTPLTLASFSTQASSR